MITSASARSPIRIRWSGASATAASTSYQGSGGKSACGERVLQALGDGGVGSRQRAPGVAVGVLAEVAAASTAAPWPFAAVACSLMPPDYRR